MTIWQQHRQYAEEMAMNGPHRGDCPFCNSKNTFKNVHCYKFC